MNVNERHSDTFCERIIGAVYEVSNTLGAGFLEKVYERALLKELRMRGLSAVAQASCPVTYKGEGVGDYYCDILVEESIVVELKCVDGLANEHLAQCLNYLRYSGLLTSWGKAGPRPDYSRCTCTRMRSLGRRVRFSRTVQLLVNTWGSSMRASYAMVSGLVMR